MSAECTRCGACCVAPDIAALGKPLGERCPHLTAENLCAVYQDRPRICRDYQADWLCERIAAPTLPERVRNYLAVFDLLQGVPDLPETAQEETPGPELPARARGAAGPKPQARGPRPPSP